ncbi:MAG: hypothetical protein K9M98_03215 [Cephaloticoccus sp.]|nr:hypothetical protein [Cephaloticoccus sp.]MCF7759492.1 hypothetical protein [Cephaloticoccus sp.]
MDENPGTPSAAEHEALTPKERREQERLRLQAEAEKDTRFDPLDGMPVSREQLRRIPFPIYVAIIFIIGSGMVAYFYSPQ